MCHRDAKSAWQFKTANFTVRLEIVFDYGYRYDGDDEDGETQAKLDSGKYVAFDSSVVVYFRGEEIAAEHLGGSVYTADAVSDFWTAHRDPNPMHRNSSIRKAATGSLVAHYFPDMVTQAIREARKHFADMPRLRTIAA